MIAICDVDGTRVDSVKAHRRVAGVLRELDHPAPSMFRSKSAKAPFSFCKFSSLLKDRAVRCKDCRTAGGDLQTDLHEAIRPFPACARCWSD